GRASRFCGPADLAACAQGSTATPTIATSYGIAHFGATGFIPANDGVAPFYALRQPKDVGRADGNTTDTLDTLVFVDGLDRIRQTKKDGSFDGFDGRILSGQLSFDALGRVSQEGFPDFETPPAKETLINSFAFGRPAKTYSYDVLDRITSIATPDD